MPPTPRKATATQDGSKALARIRASAADGELVAVIGTGVSVALANNTIPALSWRGLVLDGFTHGVKKGVVNDAQLAIAKAQLESSDLDDLLAAADFMSRKLGAPAGDLYARWLEHVFKDVQPRHRLLAKAIRAVRAAGVPLCTLNYDPLLERVTGLPTITFADTAKVAAWVRREADGVLHLHGSWDAPATCVLGVRDYDKTLSNEVRDLYQRSLASFRRLLFVGCGDTFADPNFSALIAWLRRHMATASLEHYALVRHDEVAARDADPAWQGFVAPIGYGDAYDDLAGFLLREFEGLTKRGGGRQAARARRTGIASTHARLIAEYRAFLLKDCGQMALEGLRADLDTAQRRFDLERLFVPIDLDVSPPPPRTPKEQKAVRQSSQPAGSERMPFGAAFAQHPRMVLLALPGGGKSMLLKRLAVAYADPARREATVDELPALDLLPVLIRCREWREHVHRPILTLLGNIADVTGQAALAGLRDALVPMFRSGHALLLVDGLDEIHEDARRATFVTHLEAFLGEFPNTRAVVTSREAGFALVAPSLVRFCRQVRIAPFSAGAIRSFSELWHTLTIGQSPEAVMEAQQLSDVLLQNPALRRLAENPLLLTMLLVVKHGHGRLPPDRVSLYERAVEVLLDTWNIKGHDPLSLKEAVPPLACVAFELMRAGKQTATADEVLAIIEKARETLPQVRRYAKDTPEAFLKRVELRSSLLVEAGQQLEGRKAVPFYQFRHLTFQEYLAAVAAVNGHYLAYAPTDTVLTPLADNLTTEEWKEVIPMSAVLAGKQAQTLIATLVEQGAVFRDNKQGFDDLRHPKPIDRLTQCLVEEAEAEPQTLTAALKLIALYCRGCMTSSDWRALSRGPYGDELAHQAWLLYAAMDWDENMWLDATCAALAILREPPGWWTSDEGQRDLKKRLKSQDRQVLAVALLTCAGLSWLPTHMRLAPTEVPVEMLPLLDVDAHVFNDDPVIWYAAVWAHSVIYGAMKSPDKPSRKMLDRLLELWLANIDKTPHGLITPFGLADGPVLPRPHWTPRLSADQRRQVRDLMNRPPLTTRPDSMAAALVAFHARSVCSDREIGKGVLPWATQGRQPAVDALLKQLRHAQPRPKS